MNHGDMTLTGVTVRAPWRQATLANIDHVPWQHVFLLAFSFFLYVVCICSSPAGKSFVPEAFSTLGLNRAPKHWYHITLSFFLVPS